MIIKIYPPVINSQRFLKIVNYSNVFIKKKKIKSCCSGIFRSFGRTNTGRISSYHKGGGVKRCYRFVNKTLFKLGIVEGLEYDPYRSAFLSRIFVLDTKKLIYQIAPEGIKRGDLIRNQTQTFLNFVGHSTSLQQMPIGSIIHNINFNYNLQKNISRAAGTFSQILQKTKQYCLLKISSGELRYIPLTAIGTFGRVSNKEHHLIRHGKAGRSRWLNCRPIVRGVAMNPIDHPHGGGQGKTSAGRPSVTPWGKLTKGVPTTKYKLVNSLILKKKKK